MCRKARRRKRNDQERHASMQSSEDHDGWHPGETLECSSVASTAGNLTAKFASSAGSPATSRWRRSDFPESTRRCSVPMEAWRWPGPWSLASIPSHMVVLANSFGFARLCRERLHVILHPAVHGLPRPDGVLIWRLVERDAGHVGVLRQLRSRVCELST